jgi:parallel beta-helix repeat protein
LRAAIDAANDTPGRDNIEFDVLGGDVQTIFLITSLPEITDSIVLDGDTQPGFETEPMIELDGDGVIGNGLTLSASNSVIRGFILHSFGGHGIEIRTGGGNVVEGNYIGTDFTGTEARSNSFAGIEINGGSSNNRVGGPGILQGNLLSGNGIDGIRFQGDGSSGNLVEGNFLGTDVTGTEALGNGQYGVSMFGGHANNNVIRGNVISGNGLAGIGLFDGVSGTRIEGNSIGTDASGTFALTNLFPGIYIVGSSNNVVGGGGVNSGNLISGNGGSGIWIDDARSVGNIIQGNYIGTDTTGTNELGNGAGGIYLTDASRTVIGGNTAQQGNLISGNVGAGISLFGPSDTEGGNIIEGNYIGTDVNGEEAIPNTGGGIYLSESMGNRIGGPDAGNVISGNDGPGIAILLSDATGPSANRIESNLIGTDATESFDLGNSATGISIFGTSTNGPCEIVGNAIAYNESYGIWVLTGERNTIQGNSIYANGFLGINLEDLFVTANDLGDADTGANQLQNFPVITTAFSSGTNILVSGTLNSRVGTIYTLEFFFSGDCAELGFGEGEVFLGRTEVATDGSGIATFDVDISTTVTGGGVITATATDPAGNTSEFSECVRLNGVGEVAPTIITPPQGQAVPEGGSVTLSVTADGTPPLFYQWSLNGENLPGANAPTLTITNFQGTNSGLYGVTVANAIDAVESDYAFVIVRLPPLPFTNNFAARATISGTENSGSGNNAGATKEAREPDHGDEEGGKSVWLTWVAPTSGVATFTTLGSSFDSLLGVYTGTSLTDLRLVAGDDDGAGFLAALVEFNAVAGTAYHIAVDGYGGASGDILLSWFVEPTTELLPEIIAQPLDRTVAEGANVTFTVGATGQNLTYQWFYNFEEIPGAASPTLVITNADFSHVGFYFVVVSSGSRSLFSDVALLEVNTSDGGRIEEVTSADKFAEIARRAQGGLGLQRPAPRRFSGRAAPALARGFTGTQIFSTVGSTKEIGEPNHCGVIGGASQWFPYQPPANGILTINTDGSSFDTVLAVYTGSGLDFASLRPVACDNNSGTNGRTSRVTFQAVAGTIYYIAVDGVGGATGTVQLNYNLAGALRISNISRPPTGLVSFRVQSIPQQNFTIQSSLTLTNWLPVVTTNSATGTFDFTDPTTANVGKRFYRVVAAP